MLYPNLQINLSKKRATSGLDDDGTNATLLNTPVILDLAVQMSCEKNFPFNHTEKHLTGNLQTSLQTPIIDINQTPFFNQQSSTIVSPTDSLSNFVTPNDVLNTYTTVTESSTATSITNVYNDFNNQTNQFSENVQQINNQQSHHQLNSPAKIMSSSMMSNKQQSQESNLHQNDYSHQFDASPAYTSSSSPVLQINQYSSNLLNQHQSSNMNDNHMTTLNHHSHMANQQDQTQHPQTMTYTELKTSNHQQPQCLIPSSVHDISDFMKNNNKLHQQHHDQQPLNYLSPSSPTESSTSSSNLDRDQDHYQSFGEASSSNHSRSHRRLPGLSAQFEAKKSRMTKKQKYDAMINEEKSLMRNNEQLKGDIKDLEDMIIRYKQTIMNTVKKASN